MSLLSDATLAQMRAAQALALPDTATRTRKTYVSDGMGGQTMSESTATYAVRDSPTTGRELEIAGRITSAVTRTLTFPHDADVVADDEVTINGRGRQVIAVLQGGAWQTALRVLAVEA